MATSLSRDIPGHLPSLSPQDFSLLTTVLRDTNKHYTTIAVAVRTLIRPKHHARVRAQKLGLAVNTRASVNPNFPGREVLFQALPALERPLSASPTAGGPVLHLTKPIGRHQQRHMQDGKVDAAASAGSMSHVPAPAAAAATAGDSTIAVPPLLPSLLEYDDTSLFTNQPMLPQLPFNFDFSTPDTVFHSSSSTASSTGPATPIDDDVIFPGLHYLAEKRKRNSVDLEETNFTVEKRPKCDVLDKEELC
ncbi:hypothetical protein C8R45DRAFT_185924 [Mycena sanguinolenta]|nr:hypothetical protein C8R45DRAFT_185924 [Mycena sanguinolenta]